MAAPEPSPNEAKFGRRNISSLMLKFDVVFDVEEFNTVKVDSAGSAHKRTVAMGGGVTRAPLSTRSTSSHLVRHLSRPVVNL